MTKHIIKLNLDGGESLELELNKGEFESMSEFLERELPELEWKTEKLKAIEA